jgi:hypothetical protein
MKNYYLIYLLAAVGVLPACSELEETDVLSQEHINITGTLDSFSGESSSRTQVGGVANNGALFMEWSVGDQVGVFSDNTVNAQFTGNHTEPVAQTTFSGSVTSGDIPKYAYYPYSEEVTNLHAVPVSIPTEQIYVDENSISAYDVKATDAISNLGGGNYQLNMKQLVSLIRFEFSLTDVAGLSVDEKLVRVTLETGTSVTGDYTYDLANLESGFTSVSGIQSTSLNLTFVNQPSLVEKVIAYAVAVPGIQKGKSWHCTFLTDKHQVSFSTTALCDLEAGKYYVMPLNAMILENNDAVIEEAPAPEETANCYMINQSGEHSFLANVIGNGPKGIIPDAGFHTESAYISPKSAKLLWQDVDGFVDVASVRLGTDNRCYYTAKSNVGNAVIAVYSGEDCTGDILWSWHIWGVGDEPISDDVYTSSAGYQYTVMDRPLGAHAKESMICTLYQWGRKDPFSNQTTVYGESGAQDVSIWPVISGVEMGTLTASVLNPDKFITNSKTGTDGDWMQVPNNSLWGDDKEIPYIWPDVYSHPDCKPGWVSQKTIYDPSPVGYRVASPYVWTGFVNASDGSNQSVSPTSRLDQIHYVKYENNGWYFQKDETDMSGVYYPTTGMRSTVDGEMMYYGKYAYYFASSPHRTRTLSTGLWCGEYVPVSPKQADDNTISSMELCQRGNGYAIRCVRE